ncbi:MAG: polysaccharide biosynthesis C-terminal domain-containing protein [Paludibacteraceae bacterium]|nr:polysaccharide biosynthesis C-terminal domain-containing protein [Paludibacteraceae bacterium]
MGTIAKQSFRGTIVTYLGVAVGFVTTFFVLTRFLTSEEIGLARVLIDAATIFVGLAQLGSSSSIIRFFPYFNNSERAYHGFFFWTLVLPLLGFGLFALVYVACHAPLAAFFGNKSPLFVDYYYLVLPLAFFMLYQAIFETDANVLMHIVLPRFVREVVVRVALLVTYLLYAFNVLSMDGFVWSLCATYALAALIDMVYVTRLSTINCQLSTILKPDLSFLRAQRSLVRSYLLYTLFLLVSAVTSILAPTLSSFFITAQMGLSYTGIFAIATYMAAMVSIPYRSLVSITQPELAVAIKNGDTANTKRLLQQASSNLLLVGGFILLAIWINIDLIYALLPNGATYAVARNVVLLLGIGQLMVATFNVFLPALSYSRFYAFSLLNSLVLTVSALLLNNYLIPRYGMTGAAWATVLADVLYYIAVLVVSMCALHIQPFVLRHLKILALIVLVFGLNFVLTHFVPDVSCILHFFIANAILLTAVYVAYRYRLSPEINQLCIVHRKPSTD